jgi:hypothetical protein
MCRWFLLLYVVYMALFVLVGSLMGLSMLHKNSYGERHSVHTCLLVHTRFHLYTLLTPGDVFRCTTTCDSLS